VLHEIIGVINIIIHTEYFMPFLDEFVSEVLLKYPFQFVFAPLGNALGNLIKPCLASSLTLAALPVACNII
jgi:hypothetical protein